ncbi:DUF814 domain containing protein [Niveomyces insectorum RCEF 264]|uniref:DUF814 domain containing protein n=1 Tax=Niveomyces insectorum RCEF 264 TaxID=1081102 RepID=A0A167VC85_9HYPO|nr:DUF814 domain containing protein [Niveomyces insectorum RCEF 264]
MKQRFSSLDVRAISHELNSTLAGTRLSNVYDLVPPSSSSSSSSSAAAWRTILLRFSRNQDKYQLVVDSGFRCHLTAYDARAAAAAAKTGSGGAGPNAGAVGGGGGGGAASAPSAFVSRLRTFLSGRHLVSVAQVGTDRVIELRFSDGQLRLYLEFFSAGNVVLTDADAKVLALQRTVAAFRSASLHDVTLRVGSPYALVSAARSDTERPSTTPPPTRERVREVLQKAATAAAPGHTTTTTTTHAAAERSAPEAAPGVEPATAGSTGAGPIMAFASGPPPPPTTGKSRKKNKSLSRILALSFTDLPQVLIDHAILCAGLDVLNTAQPADVLADDTGCLLDYIVQVLQAARKLADGFTAAGPLCKGYIIATKRQQGPAEPGGLPSEAAPNLPASAPPVSDTTNGPPPPPAPSDVDYVDFHPFSPRQFETDPNYVVLPFDSFNKAADEFYSHLQGLKANRQIHQQESVAAKKLEATKRDQAQRIESLQSTQQLNARKAAAIEAHQDWVQAAIDAVNEQLQAGTDWEDLALLIANSAADNPVAALIKLPLKLAEHTITLRLSEEADDDDDDDDDEDDRGWDEKEDEEEKEKKEKQKHTEAAIDVDVQLTLSAWGNARAYYDQKRVAAVKELKTREVTSMALRNAERKVAEELRRAQKGGATRLAAPQRIRRPLWCEKFLWFLSSDGYLVLAAKDPQQCELLYRRHFRPGDVYVHADIRGSPGIVVIKNRRIGGSSGGNTGANGGGALDNATAATVTTPTKTTLDANGDAPIPPATLAQAGCLAVCASEAWDTKAGLGAYWVRADQVGKTTLTGELLPPGVFDVRGAKNHLPPPQRVLGFGLLFKTSDPSKGDHFDEQAELEAEEAGNDQQLPDEESQRGEEEQQRQEGHEQSGNAEPAHVDSDVEVAEEQNITEQKPLSTPKAEIQNQEKDEEEEEEGEEQEIQKGSEKTGDENNGVIPDVAPTGVSNWKGKGKEAILGGRASPAPSSRASATTTQTASGGGGKRGKKGKAKKLAKYKDQDEEDRAQAERLIGIAAGREKAEAKARAKAQREAEIAAYEERRRAQREKQQRAMREFEAARQAQLAGAAGQHKDDDDDGGASHTADDDGSLDVLAALVGRPAPGDVLLEAVPVCAPWAALNRLKYKVKLQPGSTKKGRAMRDVLERWRRVAEAARSSSGSNNTANPNNAIDETSQDPERMWPREVELLAGLKMEEAANCVPVGKVTLMLSGGFGGGGSGGGSGGGKGSGKGSGGKGGGSKKTESKGSGKGSKKK